MKKYIRGSVHPEVFSDIESIADSYAESGQDFRVEEDSHSIVVYDANNTPVCIIDKVQVPAFKVYGANSDFHNYKMFVPESSTSKDFNNYIDNILFNAATKRFRGSKQK